MTDNDPLRDLQYFDRTRDYGVVWRRLPHWAQAGTVVLITWRTADSLPKSAISRLNLKRKELLKSRGFDPEADWSSSLARLPGAVRAGVHWSFFEAWDGELDAAAGACVLRDKALSRIVMDSLLYFDNDRYVVTDAVVMPNHVHLLAAFRDEELLLTQCRSWKRFTATQINRAIRLQQKQSTCAANVASEPTAPRGEFWQVDQFDHLVRNEAEFVGYRQYIADNPLNAGLQAGRYCHYSRP